MVISLKHRQVQKLYPGWTQKFNLGKNISYKKYLSKMK